MEDIKYSPKTNIGISNLRDIVPERMIKVYPYEFINASKSKTFMKQNATSIADISQAGLDLSHEHLKKETATYEAEDGTTKNEDVYYFEIFAAITSDGVLDISSSTSVYGQELKEEDSLTCLGNWFYEGELESIQLGNLRFMPAMFTIGQPYDREAYLADNQAIFISTAMVEAKEGHAQYSIEELDTEGLYEFQLINMTSIEAQFVNVDIIPVQNISKLTSTSLKIKDLNGKDVPGIEIEFEEGSLINAIKAKGKDLTEIESDLDFKVLNNLAPFKMTPNNISDKLTMFADWFDYDFCSPYFVAQNAASGELLSNIIVNKDVLKVAQDMIAITYAFTSNFSDFDRITDTNNSSYGKLSPKSTIGNQVNADGTEGVKLTAIEGKNPIEVIDAVYNRYISTGVDEQSDDMKILRIVINGLARFVTSTYAISKGTNSFNQIYLPWYFSPDTSTPIKLVKSGDNYKLDPKFKIISKSRWFDISGGTINTKSDIDISEVQLIQTDRKLTSPMLPDTVAAINKLPLPGDISTTTSNDLMYMFYLPIDDDASIQKLYLNKNELIVDPNNKAIPFTTGRTPLGVSTDLASGFSIEDFVKAGVVAKYPEVTSPTQVNIHETIKSNLIVSPTILKTYDKPVRNSINPDKFMADGTQITNYATTIRHQTRAAAIADITASITAQFTAKYGDAYEFVGSLDISTREDNSFSRYYEATFNSVSYKLRQWTYTTSVILVNVKALTLSFKDRETLFDKSDWKNFLSTLGITSSNTSTIKLEEVNGKEFSGVDEIIIHQLWGNQIVIHVGHMSIPIKLFNADDETIGIQRIVFT